MAAQHGLSGPSWGRWSVHQRSPLGLACEGTIATTGRFLAESQKAGPARSEVTTHDLVEAPSLCPPGDVDVASGLSTRRSDGGPLGPERAEITC